MSDPLWHPDVAALDLGQVLAALADPQRRRVVRELAAGGDAPRLCATFAMPVAKATRTHHFRVLREAGLIRQVDLGNGRTNTLRRAELDQRFPGLLAALLAAEPPATAGGDDQMPASAPAGESTPASVR